MSTFSNSYEARTFFSSPSPSIALDVAARRWRWLRSTLFDPHLPANERGADHPTVDSFANRRQSFSCGAASAFRMRTTDFAAELYLTVAAIGYVVLCSALLSLIVR